MDQENSEEKTVSENDERDWMKAKKFWKPGRASALAPTFLRACQSSRGPLFQALPSQPWGEVGL